VFLCYFLSTTVPKLTTNRLPLRQLAFHFDCNSGLRVFQGGEPRSAMSSPVTATRTSERLFRRPVGRIGRQLTRLDLGGNGMPTPWKRYITLQLSIARRSLLLMLFPTWIDVSWVSISRMSRNCIFRYLSIYGKPLHCAFSFDEIRVFLLEKARH
jgi:hypothetical protein